MLYSGRDGNAHLSGGAMLLSRKAASCLISWSLVNDRITMARFNSRYIRTSIVQVYAPTNDTEKEAKYVFYEQVQKVLDKIPKHDILILMGDWNAKVRDQQGGEEGVVGHHGLHGERSENGERIVELCASNNMAIATILFPHKDVHKHTWYHQTPAPSIRSIMWKVEGLEDQYSAESWKKINDRRELKRKIRESQSRR